MPKHPDHLLTLRPHDVHIDDVVQVTIPGAGACIVLNPKTQS